MKVKLKLPVPIEDKREHQLEFLEQVLELLSKLTASPDELTLEWVRGE